MYWQHAVISFHLFDILSTIKEDLTPHQYFTMLQFVLLFNLTLVIAGALGAGSVARKVDPEVYMSTPEIISYYGYPAEEHWVTTEDG